MSDAALREAERRWRESGSFVDEACYLIERVRSGDLEQAKLELAAYCGHEAARIALSESPTAKSGQHHPAQTLAAFVNGLRRWGTDPPIRAHLTIRWFLLANPDPYPEELEDADEDLDWVPEALACLEEWVYCPCPRHRDGASAFDGFPELIVRESGDAKRTSELAARAASFAGSVTGKPAVLREAISQELIVWALGYGDSVRERVQARRRGASDG